MLRPLVMSLIVAAIAGEAAAEISARQLLQKYDAAAPADKAIYELILGGNHNGIAWNQTFLEAEKTICAPGRMSIENAQIVSILRQGVRNDPDIADKPYGLALLVSLQRVFPCPKR